MTLALSASAPVRPAAHSSPADDQVGRVLRAPLSRIVARHVGETTVQADLAAAQRFVDSALSAAPLVIPPGMTDVFAGGKQLRPLLVVAAARTAGRKGEAGPREPGLHERVALGASAVEMLHLASLVHDDIMDAAPTRHGVGTISARAGDNAALLAGDYLLGHAHARAAGLGGAAGRLLGRTLVRLCEGQAEEWSTVHDVDRTVASYYSAIGGKTASLVEAACRLGALAAGHGPRATAAFGRYGHQLGLGYQLRDDLLDLVASADTLGKPVGHDIANGVYTYPTLWALRRDPGLTELLDTLAHRSDPRARTALAAEAADRVRASGALDATRRAVRNRREQCLSALADATPELGCAGVALMADLADTVLADTVLADTVLGPLD